MTDKTKLADDGSIVLSNEVMTEAGVPFGGELAVWVADDGRVLLKPVVAHLPREAASSDAENSSSES